MLPHSSKGRLAALLADYGVVLMLLLLAVFFSLVTLEDQQPTGAEGARRLARQMAPLLQTGAHVLIVVRDTPEDAEFAQELTVRLRAGGWAGVDVVSGQPPEARAALARAAASGAGVDILAGTATTASWPVLQEAGTRYPRLSGVKLVWPKSYRWPNFLKPDNLLNVANQIAVIAIVAIGMTPVVITAGIDLSVGSLIALSAVVCTLLIRNLAGAERASAAGMVLCSLAAIGGCGLLGGFSGAMITAFGIPPFIATLSMMLVGSGLAFILAHGQSIYQVPDSFVWLGRGATFHLPNPVLLLLALYAAAHWIMTRTVLGRYLYAVGGNVEAARLSGVPVKTVLLLAYAGCGVLAGLGGIVMASQLKSGAPTYGQLYELYVIAAVVVGGTSLRGGEGKVLGTLIGVLVIAVIQNGMNLTGVESYTQKVVLGLVILGAVLLDILKRRGWSWWRRRTAANAAVDPQPIPAAGLTAVPVRTEPRSETSTATAPGLPGSRGP